MPVLCVLFLDDAKGIGRMVKKGVAQTLNIIMFILNYSVKKVRWKTLQLKKVLHICLISSDL